MPRSSVSSPRATTPRAAPGARGGGKAGRKPRQAQPAEVASGGEAGDGGSYGLEREEPNARRKAGWMVRVRRHGRFICRLFKDGIHGSSEAALAQAKAYRDAVIAAIPPPTNREQAVRLRRRNTSGVSGVQRTRSGEGPVWRVMLTRTDEKRRQDFPVAQYGEERAKAMAIDQRRAWLAALPAAFLAYDPHAAAVTNERFRDALEREVDVYPVDTLSAAEIDRRLAAIDARFDALRPPRLRVRVKQYGTQDNISVAISDAGRPARRKLAQVRAQGRGPAAVAEIVTKIVTDLYGRKAAAWFMRVHADAELALGRFDARVGFNICVLVPLEVIER